MRIQQTINKNANNNNNSKKSAYPKKTYGTHMSTNKQTNVRNV